MAGNGREDLGFQRTRKDTTGSSLSNTWTWRRKTGQGCSLMNGRRVLLHLGRRTRKVASRKLYSIRWIQSYDYQWLFIRTSKSAVCVYTINFKVVKIWIKFSAQYWFDWKSLPDFLTPKWERFGENLDFCQKTFCGQYFEVLQCFDLPSQSQHQCIIKPLMVFYQCSDLILGRQVWKSSCNQLGWT